MRSDDSPRELWFTAPRTVELRRGNVSEPKPGQVLARAIASGVSQGTELLLYRGEGPSAFDPSLDEPGAALYPRRYGYAWVGEVVTSSVDLALGTRVFALAPHGDMGAIDASRVRALPDDIPSERAVLAANLETAITCVWDSGASIGDAVIVIGAGVVGLLVTWIASSLGANVRVIEPSERRRAAALELGASRASAPAAEAPVPKADIVFEASGDPSQLDCAILHAANEARIVVASFYGKRSAPLALGSEFHRRRLTLRSSQVSSIPPERAPRWSHERRFDLVLRLLRNEILDLLIDDVAPFDEAPAIYARLDRSGGEHLQTVFTYR